MYQKIISDHRRSPLTSATSVTILVAPNVDALCAARIFATLFKQDDVAYRIIPASGRLELEKVADELRSNSEVRIVMVKFSRKPLIVIIVSAFKSDTNRYGWNL
jgi:cell division control protein 45